MINLLKIVVKSQHGLNGIYADVGRISPQCPYYGLVTGNAKHLVESPPKITRYVVLCGNPANCVARIVIYERMANRRIKFRGEAGVFFDVLLEDTHFAEQ